MRVIKTLIVGLALCIASHAHALDITPDGPKIINLNEDAKSVIVGNPNHINVVLDNPRMVVVELRGAGNITADDFG